MKVYGVLGDRLGHSLSPGIHNQIMDSIKVDGSFVILEVAQENLPRAVDSLKTLNIHGVSVTIPYKSTIIPYLDEVTKEALEIGAVNVISIEDGKAIGHNSDYYGFVLMLEEGGIEVADKDVVFLGGGGASKAAIAYVHAAGAASIRVVGRDEDKLAALVTGFPYIETSLFKQTGLIRGDILVNTTPLGMYPKTKACPVEKKSIDNFSAVADLIYNPFETEFIQYAKKRDLKSVGGLYMLIYQSVYAQQIWQKNEIDKAVVKPIYNHLTKMFSPISD